MWRLRNLPGSKRGTRFVQATCTMQTFVILRRTVPHGCATIRITRIDFPVLTYPFNETFMWEIVYFCPDPLVQCFSSLGCLVWRIFHQNFALGNFWFNWVLGKRNPNGRNSEVISCERSSANCYVSRIREGLRSQLCFFFTDFDFISEFVNKILTASRQWSCQRWALVE